MKKVIIEDESKEIELKENETLLDALRNNGIKIKSSCGGYASCSDCIVKIQGGGDCINSPTFEEKSHLGNVYFITKERLACQVSLLEEKSKDEHLIIKIINPS